MPIDPFEEHFGPYELIPFKALVLLGGDVSLTRTAMFFYFRQKASKGSFQITLREIGDRTLQSTRTIHRHVKELRRWGFLSVSKMADTYNQNHYVFHANKFIESIWMMDVTPDDYCDGSG